MMYHFISKFSTPLALGHYSISKLLEYNPIKNLMIGYFPNIDPSLFDQITSKLWKAYIPYFMLLNKHKESIHDEKFDQGQRRSYKMDHDLFFILVMNLIYPIFINSDVGIQYRIGFNQDELYHNSVQYLKRRSDYFDYLLK